jgi:glucose-6-phosphate 1-dehydrogenase
VIPRLAKRDALAPEVLPYPPGSWGPDTIHDLIAPRRWRLPFERRWREAKVTFV